MRLEIENIGSIKAAEINLQGMHVITGSPGMALRQLSSILGATVEALWRYGGRAGNDGHIAGELTRELTRRWGHIPPKKGEPEGRIVVSHQGEPLMEAVAAQSKISVQHPQKLPFPLMYAFRTAENIHYWAEDVRRMAGSHEVMLKVEIAELTPEEQMKAARGLALAAKILRFIFVTGASPRALEALKQQAISTGVPLHLGALEDGTLRYPGLMSKEKGRP